MMRRRHMRTLSPQDIALGLEAEWVDLLNRAVSGKSGRSIEQLREDVLVLTTEVETLLSLSVYELRAIGEARIIADQGYVKRALIKLHPLIYSRGRRD
jgi:hypothetical protein